VAALRIDDFQPGDADELVRMWRASFEHGVGIVDPNPIEDQRAYLHHTVLPTYRVRVARQGAQIVGFLAANADSVSQLFVRVDHIGQGIGSQLLRLAQDESSGSLWLFTFARNTRARRFYEHHGFRDVAHGFETTWQLEDVRFEWTRSDRAA
jgi:GNAT superfamily N-acetyltransferase